MKKRRTLLFTFLPLLLLIGIPTGIFVREYRQERLNRDLIVAIKANDTERVLANLHAGADANARDNGIKSPTFRNSLKQMFDLIFHRSQQSHSQPMDGSTALYCAVSFPDTMQLLIAFGAHVDDLAYDGKTPLMVAGNPRSVSVLLQTHAQVNTRDSKGWTALDWNQKRTSDFYRYYDPPKSKNGHNPVQEGLKVYKTVEAMLRKAGAKTGAELDAQSATPPKR
jgi:hypothetical protein